MKFFVAHKMTRNNIIHWKGSCSRDWTTATAVAEYTYVGSQRQPYKVALRLCAAI